MYRPGVDFINILQAAFTFADPKSAKKTGNLMVFFARWGSGGVKAACRTLMKMTPGDDFINLFLQNSVYQRTELG